MENSPREAQAVAIADAAKPTPQCAHAYMASIALRIAQSKGADMAQGTCPHCGEVWVARSDTTSH